LTSPFYRTRPRTNGSRGGDRKSKSPPCRRKRDKDGAPSRVKMSERVANPRPTSELVIMRPRHWTLLLVAILSAAGSLAASHASLPWLGSIGSNLAAGFLGSFLTVLLIDQAIAKERDRENRRVRTLALGQLRPLTLQLLELLCAWFRAAVKRPPERELAEIREVFSNDYYQEVRFLDFSKPAPISPPMPWLLHSATVIKEFRAAVDSVLDKYALFLDAETLEMLESLGNTHALSLIVSLASLTPWKPPAVAHRTDNVLAGEGVEEAMREDVETLLSFVSKLNQCIARPITIADLYLWRPDVGGAFGAARMTDEEIARSNPMIRIGRRLPPPGSPTGQ